MSTPDSQMLKTPRAAILVFFGARLLLSDLVEFPNHVLLALIAAVLAVSVVASIKWPEAKAV